MIEDVIHSAFSGCRIVKQPRGDRKGILSGGRSTVGFAWHEAKENEAIQIMSPHFDSGSKKRKLASQTPSKWIQLNPH